MREIEYFRTCLQHTADGRLLWKERPTSHFSSVRSARTWNTRFAGKPAFTAKNSAGYYHGTVDGKNYLAHRVIWMLEQGAWPMEEIDHRDGNPGNNSLNNLRECTRSQNLQNRSASKSKASRYVGVGKTNNRWAAYINSRALGTFRCETAAAIARRLAEPSEQGEFALSAR